VDSGKMILTAFQMMRSGVGTRKRCFSHARQRVMSRLLNSASDDKLLSASVGKNPSLRDVLRLVRPTPPNNVRRALYGWLCGNPVERWRPATYDDLPLEIRLLDRFRGTADPNEQVQLVQQFAKTYIRWDLLADAVKGEVYEGCGDARRLVRPSPVWAEIAKNMGYQALRMNLNTERLDIAQPPRCIPGSAHGRCGGQPACRHERGPSVQADAVPDLRGLSERQRGDPVLHPQGPQQCCGSGVRGCAEVPWPRRHRLRRLRFHACADHGPP